MKSKKIIFICCLFIAKCVELFLYPPKQNGERWIVISHHLKLPKSEIFDLFDFNDFNVIKSLWVGDFRDEIKLFFFHVGQIPTILSLLAYAQCTLATIFDFELAPKKVVPDSFEVHLKLSKYLFLIFPFFHWFKLDLG
jgi:hypothetical protein